MADDGEIRINTKIDTSGVDKGVHEVKGKLDKAGKGIEALGKGTAGAVAAAAIAASKKIGEAIRETSEAYKVQAKAETALKTAAMNNPYINDEAVAGLKRFASELQATSDYGDEFTLRYAAQLVAAGRTQDQIQDILTQSANLAASGLMSFDSAVKNLSKTYGGLAGELGESIPALRNLTQEELKQGKAVELIAKQYGGFAEELADARVQAQNAKGDFKEAVGALTAPAATAWDNFWKGFYEKGQAAIKWLNDKLLKANLFFNEGEFLEKINTVYTNKETGEEIGGETLFTTEQLKNWQEYYKGRKDLTAAQQQAVVLVNKELSSRKNAAEWQAEQTKETEKQLEAQQKIENINNKADDLAIRSNESLEQTITKIRLKAELTGEEVDEQEIYNAILENYINLLTDEGGIIKDNYPAAEARLKQLQDQADALKDYNEAQELKNKLDQFDQAAAEKAEDKKSEYQRLKDEGAALAALRDEVANSEILAEEEKAAKLKEIDEEIAQNKKDLWAQATLDISDYLEQVDSIVGQSRDLMLKGSKTESDAELKQLEVKYKKGEIGEKEYAEKKAEIKRKAAQDEYKINMFAWTSSLLTATANIAQGVSKAIAQGGLAGIATGALVAAAGGVQIASIIGSKPQPPAFEHGGIVGGNSFTGDNIMARVNSGEMVLTRAQQRALFNMANGVGSGTPNITVNNSASNLVTAQPKISQGEIALMIDARVNESLQAGRYDTSLNMAQQGQSGDFYGI